MDVNVTPGNLLGPFFSKLVKERLGEDAAWSTVSRLLIQSANIGAAFRRHGLISIDESLIGAAATRQLSVKRRIRFEVHPDIHRELYDFLSRDELDRVEAVMYLSEIFAANHFGALDLGNAKANLAQGISSEKSRGESSDPDESITLSSDGEEVNQSAASVHQHDNNVDSVKNERSVDEPIPSQSPSESGSKEEGEPLPRSVLEHSEKAPDAGNENTGQDEDDTFAFLSEMADKSH